MKKLLTVVSLLFALGFIAPRTVIAACNPPECNDPNNSDATCDAQNEHCVAKCCVANNGGGGCNSDNDCGGNQCCKQGVCSSNCGGPPPSCTIGTPTNLNATATGLTSANITWTRGSGGVGQAIFVGANLAEVLTACQGLASPACVIENTGLSSSTQSYATGNVLTTGTVYYARVINYLNANCYQGSATATHLSSCQPSASSITLNAGDDLVTATSINSSSEITQAPSQPPPNTTTKDWLLSKLPMSYLGEVSEGRWGQG